MCPFFGITARRGLTIDCNRIAGLSLKKKKFHNSAQPKAIPHCNSEEAFVFYSQLRQFLKMMYPSRSTSYCFKNQCTNCRCNKWLVGFNSWVNWIVYDWRCKFFSIIRCREFLEMPRHSNFDFGQFFRNLRAADKLRKKKYFLTPGLVNIIAA